MTTPEPHTPQRSSPTLQADVAADFVMKMLAVENKQESQLANERNQS